MKWHGIELVSWEINKVVGMIFRKPGNPNKYLKLLLNQSAAERR